jgi:hypothetical protein
LSDEATVRVGSLPAEMCDVRQSLQVQCGRSESTIDNRQSTSCSAPRLKLEQAA